MITGDQAACFTLGTPINTAPGTYYVQVNKNDDISLKTIYLNPGYMKINIITGT